MTVVPTIRIITFNALWHLYLVKFKFRIVRVIIDITRALSQCIARLFSLVLPVPYAGTKSKSIQNNSGW